MSFIVRIVALCLMSILITACATHHHHKKQPDRPKAKVIITVPAPGTGPHRHP
jgi:hypothetical protein